MGKEEKVEQNGIAEDPRKRILKQLQANKESLSISRIPPKTKEAFIKLSEDEFCGDYGMCLKFLMDDLIDADVKMIIATLQSHESRIQALENKDMTSKSELKIKKMLDGSTKVIPGDKDE
jgi:hypothetical protein